LLILIRYVLSKLGLNNFLILEFEHAFLTVLDFMFVLLVKSQYVS